MSFLARAFERKAADPLAVWEEMLRKGTKSKAGATINLDTALKVAALFACLRVLSQGCAQVPFKLMREVEKDGLRTIEPARDHPLYDLMTVAPNAWQTSFEFREQLVIHAALGNAYVWMNRGLTGNRLLEVIILDPGRMQVEQPDPFEPPVFKYSLKDGKTITFSSEQIWHVRGPSWAGFAGLPVLQIAREALGLAIATEETHARLHEKGVRPSGTYSIDGKLSKEQHDQLRKWIVETTNGENAGSPLILDNGAKWLSQTMSGVDAQHLETRRFQIEEVCRFTGVSPLMVFYSDKATTYASAEQMFLAHVVHTLAPWYARIEQSADKALLTQKERAAGLYWKFNAAGLLRGAMKDQGEFFSRLLGAGGTRQVATVDEIRALMDWNPLGGDAAILHAPQGTSPPKPDPASPDANQGN